MRIINYTGGWIIGEAVQKNCFNSLNFCLFPLKMTSAIDSKDKAFTKLKNFSCFNFGKSCFYLKKKKLY